MRPDCQSRKVVPDLRRRTFDSEENRIPCPHVPSSKLQALMSARRRGLRHRGEGEGVGAFPTTSATPGGTRFAGVTISYVRKQTVYPLAVALE